jgi:hypothetical protein
MIVSVCYHDNSRKNQPILMNDSLKSTIKSTRRQNEFKDGLNPLKGSKVMRKKSVATDQNPGFVPLFIFITFEQIDIFN